MGMQNATSIWEDTLMVYYKTKHIFTTRDPAVMLLGIYPKVLKDMEET